MDVSLPLWTLFAAAVALAAVAGWIGWRVAPPSRDAQPRLTFVRVRINGLALAAMMLTAFLFSMDQALEFLKVGIEKLSQPGSESEGVNQILLAVIGQSALFVLLSALGGPLSESFKSAPGE